LGLAGAGAFFTFVIIFGIKSAQVLFDSFG
jgi:hypothetical protein